jgi:2-hydroxycyclohexanecarboxyl-CoA dehydrogenase
MVQRGGGAIVNISSDAGRVGSSGEVVYSGAKAGIIGFSKAVAREVARHGIRVNVVCPGPTDTPMMEATREANPRLGEALVKAIPFRRLAQPEEIAAAVAFFASDEAAYVTGQTLSVSGGLTMA